MPERNLRITVEMPALKLALMKAAGCQDVKKEDAFLTCRPWEGNKDCRWQLTVPDKQSLPGVTYETVFEFTRPDVDKAIDDYVLKPITLDAAGGVTKKFCYSFRSEKENDLEYVLLIVKGRTR